MGIIFGVPVISIFIFIGAGLLLGNLLWYRDVGALERRIRELEQDLVAAGDASGGQSTENESLSRTIEEQNSDLLRLRDELLSLRRQNSELDEQLQRANATATFENDGANEFEAKWITAQGECESLRELLDQANAAQRIAEDRIAANQAATIEASEEMIRLSEQIDSLTQDNAARLAQIDQLQDLVARLNLSSESDVAERESLITNLKSELAESEMYRAATQDKLDAVRDQFESSRDLMARCEQTIETLQQTIVDRNEEIALHQQQLAGALDQAERTADQNERLADLVEEKQRRIAELEERVKAGAVVEVESKRTIDELAELRNVCASLHSQLDDRMSALEDRDRLIASLRAESDSLRKLQTQHHSEIQDVRSLTEQLDAAAEANLHLQDTNATLIERVEAGLHQVEHLTAKLLDQENLSQRVTEQTQTIESLESDNQNLIGKLQANIEKLDHLTTNLRDRDAEILELTERCDELSQFAEEKATLKRRLAELQRIEAGLRASLIDQDNEIEVLREKETALVTLQKRLGDANVMIEHYQIQQAEWKDVLDEQRSEIASLQHQLGQIKPLRSELAEHQERLAVTTALAESLGSELQDRDAIIANLNRRIGSVAELEKQLILRQRDVDALRAQSEQQTLAFDEQRVQLVRLRDEVVELEVSRQQLQTAHDRLAQATERCETLDAANRVLETTTAKLAMELKQQAQTIEALTSQLATRSAQHESAVDDLRNATDVLKRQSMVVDQLQEQVQELEELRAANRMLDAKTTDLISHLKRVSAEHEDSLQANERAQSAIQDLQNEIHAQTATIRMLRRQRGSVQGLGDDGGGDSKAA